MSERGETSNGDPEGVFGLAPEQERPRSSVRARSGRAGAAVRVRYGRVHRMLWREMADLLGLQGTAISERYGASGGSPVELAVVIEEAVGSC